MHRLVICSRSLGHANSAAIRSNSPARPGRPAAPLRRDVLKIAHKSPGSSTPPRGLRHDFRHWLAVMAEPGNTESPSVDVDFNYWRLWVSADGHTHITQCTMSGFELVGYSKSPQAVREKGIPKPKKVIFTELPAHFDNPWHYCPCSQFVLVTHGSWFVRTTDGTEVTLGTKDMLYQDNTSAVEELVKGSTVENAGQHFSGTSDDKCQQVIMQVERAPHLDEAVPF